MSKEKLDRTAYKNQFIAANYDRINLTVPKGKKKAITEHATANGESVNGYINRLIDSDMAQNDEKEG